MASRVKDYGKARIYKESSAAVTPGEVPATPAEATAGTAYIDTSGEIPVYKILNDTEDGFNVITEGAALLLLNAPSGQDGDAFFSAIEGQWQRSFHFWEGGHPDHRYFFWGDLKGTLRFWELQLDAYVGADPVTVLANWAEATNIAVYCAQPADEDTGSGVIRFDNMCYETSGVQSRRMKQMGERLVLEGSTEYQILATDLA